MQQYDFVEFLQSDDRPWGDWGRIISDPGHCLEFTGLAAKALLMMDDAGLAGEAGLVQRCRELLPEILLHNFNNGFNRLHGGIYKTFDLISRRPIDGNMPW
ncbi:MAG: hypothetical protein PHT33_01895 [bacterium]|nr:hypothetical protein [bacterium]